MSSSSVAEIMNTGQRELEAFLSAATEVFGEERTQQASDLWLQSLEDAAQIDVDVEKFFRQVTIQAANRLALAFSHSL